jgi:hypothetical protein
MTAIPPTMVPIACGAAFTSPRSPSGRLRPSSTGYGEVGICALVAQIPGEGAAPPALNSSSELVETPPHPGPLPARGERERGRSALCDCSPATPMHSSRRRPSRVYLATAAALALSGLWLVGDALYMRAKAALAQVLLNRAFAAEIVAGTAVKPWPWADTWPVARIGVPRLKAHAIVLAGGSGQALAFGPGHLERTPEPGEPGTAVYAPTATPISRSWARLKPATTSLSPGEMAQPRAFASPTCR